MSLFKKKSKLAPEQTKSIETFFDVPDILQEDSLKNVKLSKIFDEVVNNFQRAMVENGYGEADIKIVGFTAKLLVHPHNDNSGRLMVQGEMFRMADGLTLEQLNALATPISIMNLPKKEDKSMDVAYR
jgi:hypothetical protein